MREYDLDRLLRPSSIAVVGASESGGPGTVLSRNLVRSFDGRLQLVNPRRSTIFDRPTVPSLAEVDAHVDLVAVALGTAKCLPLVEEAHGLGMRQLLVVADGFDDPDVRMSNGQSLREYCLERKIAMCGPNCLGYLNFVDETYAAIQAHDEHVERAGRGNVALVSQSGGMLLATLATAAGRGVGYTYAVSSGSEFSVGVEDYLEWLAEDDETEVIGLLLEGLNDGPRFVAAVNRALAAGKPVLTFKLGRTARGQSAAAAHTGKVAGDARVFESVVGQLGAAQCRDLGEFVETMVAFARTRGRKIHGNRLITTMISGGAATYIADLTEGRAIEMPPIPAEVQERLAERLPADAHLDNPLDISGGNSVMNPQNVVSILDTLATSGSYDCVAFVVPMRRWGGPPHIQKFHGEIVRYTGRTDVPVFVLVVNPDALGDYWSDVVKESDALALHDLPRALPALARVLNFPEVTAAARRRRDDGWDATVRQGRPAGKVPRRTVGALKARRLLGSMGLRFAGERIVKDVGEAVAAAEAMGYPAVLKVETPSVPHKREAGLVVVGAEDAEQVAREASRLLDEIRAHDWEDPVLVVQELVPADTEFLLGMVRDETFGPMVVVGAGGTLVELMPDASVVLLPPHGSSVADAVKGNVTLSALVEGYRRSAGISSEALGRLVADLHELARTRPDVLSVDINPVVVHPRTGDVVGLDLLVEVADTGTGDRSSQGR